MDQATPLDSGPAAAAVVQELQVLTQLQTLEEVPEDLDLLPQ